MQQYTLAPFDLFEDLALLLEAKGIQDDALVAAKGATDMPISIRKGVREQDIYIVIDGPKRGDQAADDHEVDKVFRAVESELSKHHEVERLFDSRTDIEKPTGLIVYQKNATKRALMSVRFVKKPNLRSKHDGDPKAVHAKFKISPHADSGKKNELLFVKILESYLADNSRLTIVFDGYCNNRELSFASVVSVRHVGGKNRKPDVEFELKSGKIAKLSLKQRDFFEIDAGNSYLESHEAEVSKYLETALDKGQVEINGDDKFSKSMSFEVAHKMTRGEARQMYFGEEGDVVDGVIIETFLDSDFKLHGDKLIIKCDYVLTSTDDIHDRLWPYVSLNSDFEKSNKYARPVLGKIFMSIIPRFKIQTHERRGGGKPKTFIV